MKKIALITRTKPPRVEQCLVFVKQCMEKCNIPEAFICVMASDEEKAVSQGKIHYIYTNHDNPAAVLNRALREIGKRFDYFFIISPEVNIFSKNFSFRKMLQQFDDQEGKILVVGHGIKLKDYYSGTEKRVTDDNFRTGVGYQVPWSTCALWDLKLFDKLVGEFDPICDSQLGPLKLEIFNPPRIDVYRGMEDGLAIAKAVNADKDVYAVLLQDEIEWFFNADDQERLVEHENKMARKSIVLDRFLKERGYDKQALLDHIIRM